MFSFLASRLFLAAYSALLTVVLVATVTIGAGQHLANTAFDQITVHRVNIVEPDGTPRLILSDKAQFPGAYIHGKLIPRSDRDSAGMIFLNDEGTENGGLIFGGQNDAQGPHSYGHLSFDRYDQDQVLVLEHNQDGDHRNSGLAINDTHDYPITAQVIQEGERFKAMPHGPARAQAYKDLQTRYPAYVNRAYFGRNPDKSVGLTLRDQQGRERIRIRVAANGTPEIQLLDENGKVSGGIITPPNTGTER